jgi:PIF1-like helicase
VNLSRLIKPQFAGGDLSQPILTVRQEGDDDNAPAVTKGPNSGLGRRDAYEAVIKSQWATFGSCDITLFSLLTAYDIHKDNRTDKRPQMALTVLLKLNAHGKTIKIIPIIRQQMHYKMTSLLPGLIINGPQKFLLNGLLYSKLARPVIVNVSPYVPIDNSDEKSAYATILLHTPWPIDGEEMIMHPEGTAVAKLQNYISTDQLPTYVIPMMEKQRSSANFSTASPIEPQIVTEIDQNENDGEQINFDNSYTDMIDHQSSVEYPQPIRQFSIVDGVFTQITTERNSFYKNFIQRAQDDYMAAQARENQIEDSIQQSNSSNSNQNIVEEYEERLAKLNLDIETLTAGQRSAFDKAIKHISGDDPTQLIMFISGEGGTGKSYLIALIMEYTRLKFGKQRGIYGAAVAMAPTGCAANVIKGFTWQSCYSKSRLNSSNDDKVSQTTAKKIGAKFHGIKLAVLDEISMVKLEDLAYMSNRHKQGQLAITDDEEERKLIMTKPFAGMHILFTGDLWQLKPIGGHPVYTSSHLTGQALEGQKIWQSINEFVELKENYRFKNDPTTTLMDFLREAREGRVDTELLMKVNSRIVFSNEEALEKSHPSACWMSHTKATVAKFNKLEFQSKIDQDKAYFRIVAKHTPASQLVPHPLQSEREKLFKIVKQKGAPAYIDLAIGSRVSCVRNLGTQIGKISNSNHNHINHS